MTTRFYCTYFDSNYLPRFLTLYHSLARVSGRPVRVFALCFDPAAHAALQTLALPGVVAIRLQDFERDDERLVAARPGRTRVEYYFTCTASLVLYVLRHHPEVDLLTYLDADLYFFRSPEPVFEELGDAPILVIAHRHAPAFRDAVRFGRFNVGFLSFRRDETARACLEWWRDRCIEWCFDRCEPGRFADQKYLDEWPVRFPAVHEVRHRGANVAPWNLPGYCVQLERDGLRVDGDPLLFYHFEGLHWVGRHLLDPGLSWPGRIPARVVRRVHLPYVRELIRWQRRCAKVLGGPRALGNARTLGAADLSWARRVRLLLEGRHVGVWADRLLFLDSPVLRAAVHAVAARRRKRPASPATAPAPSSLP